MTEKAKLRGRITFVTGAGNGVRPAEAKALAGLGTSLPVQAIQQDFAGETAQEIVDVGSLAETLVCDVANLDAMTSALEGLERDDRGAGILVNNAGMAETFLVLGACSNQPSQSFTWLDGQQYRWLNHLSA